MVIWVRTQWQTLPNTGARTLEATKVEDLASKLQLWNFRSINLGIELQNICFDQPKIGCKQNRTYQNWLQYVHRVSISDLQTERYIHEKGYTSPYRTIHLSNQNMDIASQHGGSSQQSGKLYTDILQLVKYRCSPHNEDLGRGTSTCLLEDYCHS